MPAPVFVDTNVLVYALDQANPKKHRAARAWRTELWKRRLGRTSFQVLQEFYVTVTRKRIAASADARAEIRDLLTWRPVAVDAAIVEHGWDLQDRYALSFWDALIVAAAHAASCRYLLTEDLQADQRLGDVLIVSPFDRQPETLE